MRVGREEDRLRHGDAGGAGHDVVEELVVGRPPERVVDDDRALRRELLEHGPVEWDVLADPVEDQVVGPGRFETHGPDVGRLGHDAGGARAVDPVHQRQRESPLLSKENADAFHESRRLYRRYALRKGPAPWRTGERLGRMRPRPLAWSRAPRCAPAARASSPASLGRLLAPRPGRPLSPERGPG